MSYLTVDYIEQMLDDELKMTEGIKHISKDITNNVFTILHLSEKMEVAFTSSNPKHRIQGTQLMARVLANLPKDHLSQESLSVLATFYVMRLKDHHNVIPPVIEAFLALSHMTHLSGDSVIEILTNIFQNIPCAQQLLSDRYRIYKILERFIKHFSTDLKRMAREFLLGLIGTIEGERDPHNLDLIFSFMEKVIKHFDLEDMSEDIFETLSCYFPVDFRPSFASQKDKDSTLVTRDSLAAKLCDCLIASSDFIEGTVELALEKLDSELVLAKTDSLKLLSELVTKQTYQKVCGLFQQIWKALKNELIPGYGDKGVVLMALETLRTFLYKAKEAGSHISHDHQTLVLSNVIGNFDDINSNLYEPSIRVALICVNTDTEFVTERILPLFITKLQETPLSLTNEEATIIKPTSLSPATSNVLKNNFSIELHIRTYNLFIEIFQIATSTLVSLQSLPSTTSNINIIDKALCETIYELVLNTLDKIEQSYDIYFNMELLRSTLSVLQASVEMIKRNQNTQLNGRIHEHLKWLIYHDSLDITDITKVLIEHLVQSEEEIKVYMTNFIEQQKFIKEKILKNLLPLGQKSPYKKTVQNWLYSLAFSKTVTDEIRFLAIETLNNLLLSMDREQITDLQHDSGLITKYIDLLQTNYANKDVDTIDESHHNHLSQITRGLSLVMKALPTDEQYQITKHYFENTYKLDTFSDAYIAKGILGFLDTSHSLGEHLEPLLDDIIHFSLNHSNRTVREVSHHLLCSVTNKIHHKNHVDCSILSRLKSKLLNLLHEGKETSIELLSWLAKSLMMNGFDEGVDIIEALIDLLDHPNFSNTACFAFEIISVEISHLDLHLPICGFLYKQKLIHLMLRKLGKKILDSMSKHHLKAIITVLKIVPHHILKLYILQIGPILFYTLNTSDDTKVLLTSLVICENFVRHEDPYFRDHLKSFVPTCLKLSQNMSSMNIRIGALHLLSKTSSYPPYIVQPYRTEVILGLKPALDDPKRLVRNAAVVANNLWYLV